jgi:hypothetical protein
MLTSEQFKKLCYEHAQVSNTSGVYLTWSSIEKFVAAINGVLGEQPADERKDAERMQFVEDHPGWLTTRALGTKRQGWACANPASNYEYDLHKTAREAIDRALAEKGECK